MKKHTHIETCPICDSQQIEIRHDLNMRYRYLKKEHVLEGQEHTVCLNCGLSFYQPGQIDRNNERFFAFEKSIVKGISPNEIRSLREEYLMTQEQAARIFDCGKTAFSKWERGEVAPTGPTALLLKMALENPEFMKKLADKAGEVVDIQIKPPKQEEKKVDFYPLNDFMEASTVIDMTIQHVVFTKNKRFIIESRKTPYTGGYENAFGYGVLVDSIDDDDGPKNQHNIPEAWMINNFQAA